MKWFYQYFISEMQNIYKKKNCRLKSLMHLIILNLIIIKMKMSTF